MYRILRWLERGFWQGQLILIVGILAEGFWERWTADQILNFTVGAIVLTFLITAGYSVLTYFVTGHSYFEKD